MWGDAPKTPPRNCHFWGRIRCRNAGNINIIAQYYAREGPNEFGEEFVLAVAGGTFDWQQFVQDLHFVKRCELRSAIKLRGLNQGGTVYEPVLSGRQSGGIRSALPGTICNWAWRAGFMTPPVWRGRRRLIKLLSCKPAVQLVCETTGHHRHNVVTAPQCKVFEFGALLSLFSRRCCARCLTSSRCLTRFSWRRLPNLTVHKLCKRTHVFSVSQRQLSSAIL